MEFAVEANVPDELRQKTIKPELDTVRYHRNGTDTRAS